VLKARAPNKTMKPNFLLFAVDFFEASQTQSAKKKKKTEFYNN